MTILDEIENQEKTKKRIEELESLLEEQKKETKKIDKEAATGNSLVTLSVKTIGIHKHCLEIL